MSLNHSEPEMEQEQNFSELVHHMQWNELLFHQKKKYKTAQNYIKPCSWTLFFIYMMIFLPLQMAVHGSATVFSLIMITYAKPLKEKNQRLVDKMSAKMARYFNRRQEKKFNHLIFRQNPEFLHQLFSDKYVQHTILQYFTDSFKHYEIYITHDNTLTLDKLKEAFRQHNTEQACQITWTLYCLVQAMEDNSVITHKSDKEDDTSFQDYL